MRVVPCLWLPVQSDDRCKWNDRVILVCYDGSTDAQRAIDRAGELLRGQSATVLTVWDGLAEVLARAGTGVGAGALDFEAIDAASERSARERAGEGAGRARRAGLTAEPRVRERGLTIWGTILEQAAELDASAIVLGSRGLTGLKSLLLGSVSHGVLQHADRPVIVVPSGELAAKRAADER
jgi:nucleotide-binding universal stress UspA family protein